MFYTIKTSGEGPSLILSCLSIQG